MREYAVSVLIRPAPDVEGQWLAQCLDWNLVSQGSSPLHAMAMIAEAVVMAVQDDLEQGLDPSDRERADDEEWAVFVRTRDRGDRLTKDDLERLAGDRGVRIAGYMHIRVPVEESSDAGSRFVPDPHMIAAHESAAVG